MRAPFWALMVVGIVRVVLQKLCLAFAGRLLVRAECGPMGSFNSKLEIGASGTEAKVLVVMPLAMLMFPTTSRVTPCASP